LSASDGYLCARHGTQAFLKYLKIMFRSKLSISFRRGSRLSFFNMCLIFREEIYCFPYRFKASHKSARKMTKETFVGFTLIELMVVIAIVGTLSGIGIPAYNSYIEKAKITKTIAEIRLLEKEIRVYEVNNEMFPDTLNDIGRENFLDTWGNPYQYLNFANIKGKGKGKMRKDRFLVPINSDFDLYSMGKDGKSQTPLTAKASHDDIIFANNGEYVGIASEY